MKSPSPKKAPTLTRLLGKLKYVAALSGIERSVR